MNIEKRAKERKKRIVAHVSHSFEEADRWDLEYWQSLSPASRLSALVAIRRDIEKVKKLKTVGANIIIAGSGRQVNLNLLLEKLGKMNVKKLLLEGGGTLNWSMIKENLVDEVKIAVAPTIVGGTNAITLVEGEGFRKVKNGFKLHFISTEKAGEDIILTYKKKPRLNS